MVWQQLGNDIDRESMVDFSGWSTSLSSDGLIVPIGAQFAPSHLISGKYL